MWHYLPDTAIVNNIEFDHADIYRDEEAYKFAFARFINLIPKNGVLVAGWDSPITRELAPKSFAPVESFGYGDDTPPPSGQPHWHARDVEFSESGTTFRAFRSKRGVGPGRDAARRRFQREETCSLSSRRGSDQRRTRRGTRRTRDVRQRETANGNPW